MIYSRTHQMIQLRDKFQMIILENTKWLSRWWNTLYNMLSLSFDQIHIDFIKSYILKREKKSGVILFLFFLKYNTHFIKVTLLTVNSRKI